MNTCFNRIFTGESRIFTKFYRRRRWRRFWDDRFSEQLSLLLLLGLYQRGLGGDVEQVPLDLVPLEVADRGDQPRHQDQEQGEEHHQHHHHS